VNSRCSTAASVGQDRLQYLGLWGEPGDHATVVVADDSHRVDVLGVAGLPAWAATVPVDVLTWFPDHAPDFRAVSAAVLRQTHARFVLDATKRLLVKRDR
jgi:hypothetical protein